MRGLGNVALLLLLWASCCCWCLASKILFVAPIGTKSQVGFLGAIIEALADRGHQVSFITSYSGPKHPNVTEINGNIRILEYMPNIFQNRNDAALRKLDYIIPGLCWDALQQDTVRGLDLEDFDVIFLFAIRSGNDCFLLRLQNAKVPLILVTPVQLDLFLHVAMGNVDFPSFVTALGQTEWHPMNFLQRVQNMAASVKIYLTIKWDFVPRIELICRELGECRENATSLEDVASRAAFVFVNSVRSLESPPRPYVPSVVHIGGVNCRPAQPLPQDLESWVAGAGDAGFIYMSLGTVVKSSDMPDNCRQSLLKVFSSLPQRVLWKWDTPSVEGLPPNVRVVQWAPQQDILGHPKLRVFMTQGGVFSSTEATYHGVPVLGMPVFFDQITNVNRIVTEGWGEAVDWDHLTEEILADKIHRLIHNSSYRATAQKRSLLMKDQPMSPKDAVVYWTEYAIRHRGAPHLHSPARDMPWYTLYNVDVWAVAVMTVAVLLAALTKLLLALAGFVRRLMQMMNNKTKLRQD
uniref:UDP-glucuronosyltransferase-like n=1 Tax=Hirondellea gigas TaxID=1518452 RepID=A0A6A7G3D9_9CRUS